MPDAVAVGKLFFNHREDFSKISTNYHCDML